LLLRKSLVNAVGSLGGVTTDPALGRMVLIGHSQGGLLIKLSTIETGTKLWDVLSERPIDELNLRPETRTLLKDALFLHPLPFVETVVFISTPHRGSYLAGYSLAGMFVKLITLPVSVATATADLLSNANALHEDVSVTEVFQHQRHETKQSDHQIGC